MMYEGTYDLKQLFRDCNPRWVCDGVAPRYGCTIDRHQLTFAVLAHEIFHVTFFCLGVSYETSDLAEQLCT